MGIRKGAICTAIAVIGVGVTTWLTAKNTPEALERKEQALKAKREKTGNPDAKLTFWESVQAQAKAYWPTIGAGALTIAGIVGGDYFNKEDILKAKKAMTEYKDMHKKLDGEGAVKTVEKAVEQEKEDKKKNRPWQNKKWFLIKYKDAEIEFESTREDVISGLYEANRYFVGRGSLSFNNFLEFLGLAPKDYLTSEEFASAEQEGWDQYTGEALYGYSWIDFALMQDLDSDVTEIYMPFQPHPMDYEEARKEIEHPIEEE